MLRSLWTNPRCRKIASASRSGMLKAPWLLLNGPAPTYACRGLCIVSENLPD